MKLTITEQIEVTRKIHFRNRMTLLLMQEIGSMIDKRFKGEMYSPLDLQRIKGYLTAKLKRRAML